MKMGELLDGRIDRVRFVIIHGMGGIGKTTLAKVIFNEVSSEFQGCSFLENIRESSRGNGIIKLQQQIMDDIFRMSVSIHNVDHGINEIKEGSRRNKKGLLVLDDVDDKDQIQKLAGMFNWFGRGSRIIVPTRDSNVTPIELKLYMKDKMQNVEGEEDLGDIFFYKMRGMNHQHAATLFKTHAFGDDEYSFDDDDLLQKIVLLADGLPLTLRLAKQRKYGENL
ncbi:hypothetical protein MLD38_037632 [Melastoma candidum]|uniref:Uncharacterized protein n=1 Tax=Melastoma candidum TaxID=119954 RepID=A0ACB9LMN4_9MYRT|nr:hypothetical protein MLD38_037632 [Melastoma candidum]